MTESKQRPALALFLLGLGLVLIAVSAYYIYQNVLTQFDQADFPTVPVQVNFPAPELTLTDTHGKTHSLAEYRGQVVLVNLWATWCPPCKQEMPTLQSFYNKYKDNGFVVIAVDDGDPASDVLQFAKDYQLTFSIWLDPTYSATEKAFNTLNLPSSYIIDRNGIVRLMWVGGISRRMLDQHVTPLILENQ